MTLNAAFLVDGWPVLIADFLVTGYSEEEREHNPIPSIVDLKRVLPPEYCHAVTDLRRKAVRVAPNCVAAGSGMALSVQHVLRQLSQLSDGKPLRLAAVRAALQEVSDLDSPAMDCTVIGWVLEESGPEAFRWNSRSPLEVTVGKEFVEGSGRDLFKLVSPQFTQRVHPERVFEGVAEVCGHVTGTLVINEILKGNTIQNLFGGGYDAWISDGSEFRLVESIAYLFFKVEFLGSFGDNSVDYRFYQTPVYVGLSYVGEIAFVRGILPPANGLGVESSQRERIGLAAPLELRAGELPDVAMQPLPFMADRYVFGFAGADVDGNEEVFTAVVCGDEAKAVRIGLTGDKMDGLDELKFEVPSVIMGNMFDAAIKTFERGGTRIRFG